MKSCGLTVPSEPPDLWQHVGGVCFFGYAAHEIERIPMIFLEISQDSLQPKMVGSSYLLMMRPFF